MKMEIPLCAAWRPTARVFNARPQIHSKPPSLSSSGLSRAQRRCFRTSQIRREEKRSFRGQLYESTAQRLARERAEESRHIINREKMGPGKALQIFALTTLFLAGCGTAYWMGSLKPRPLPRSSTTTLSDSQPPVHDARDTILQAAWVDFANIVGKDNVSTDSDDLSSHSGSEWSTYQAKDGEKPFLIVYPSTTAEVSEIMKVCHARKIPVTAICGGTSLEGHFAPTRGGICIDFMRMDKIKALHREDLDVVVQPAVGWEDLNETLADDGLFFPPDPGPGAKVGGMVGTGCSGTNAYRYGTMREWVLALTVVLADGTIVKTRQRPRKSSAGYDLTRVFLGSEGTLGLVTEAVLKVTVKPKGESVAVATFPTIHSAAECVSKVVGEGIQVAGVEVLDDEQMRLINKTGTAGRRWSEAPTLFFKFAGSPSGIKEQVTIVQKLAKQCQSNEFEFARGAEEARQLWSARKDALWSVMAMRRDASDHVWTTDVAVPISRLPDIMKETKEDIRSSGLISGMVGHVGDGNFHALLLFNDSERKVAEKVVHRMVKRAVEMEGTVTGEHGVGLIKRDYLEHELGETAVDAMRRLKQAFDPMCLLNCDKVVRIEAPQKGEVQPW